MSIFKRLQFCRRAPLGKVSIRYGSGKTQISEIKAGGGFHSFEAPEAHFGLGSHFAVQSMTVQWSDGTKSRIDSELRAGHTITVKRRS